MKFIPLMKKTIARMETLLNRLRARIPGLPGNRTVFAAVGLGFAALVLFATFQLLLAPKQKFTTYTLPYEQNFDDVDLRRWFVGDGVWSIRLAALAQTVGGDTPSQAFVPYKLIEDSPYHASVYITLKKDSRAAGISFNAQYPDLKTKQHRIYLLRPDPTSLDLVAGYMDATGSFVTQVQVPLSINTTEFRIDLYVYSNTYLVQVNGQRLIDNRPLFYKNGLIGFYALGPAIFDTFKLTAADNPNPGNLVYTSDFDQNPGGAGWVPFAGAWKIADKQMVQTDPIIVNSGIGYESSSFQNFTLRVTFDHISGQGAGVLFNMPSPYDLNGAQLVRYSDETDSLIWGYFDAKGAFNRQGFTNIAPAGNAPHTLQIFSGDISYDVFLDDQLLIRDVPLQSKQGNIGLITSGASAGFSLVEVYPLFGVSGAPTGQLTPVAQNGTPSSTPASAKATPTFTPVSAKATPKNPVGPSAAPTLVITPKSPNTSAAPAATLNAATGIQSPYHGVFTGKLSDQGWVVINGDWRFQNGNFVQLLTNGYDLTTIYTKTSVKNFSYQVGLTHQQGSGAGLLFNLPYNDRLTGGSMVRYSDKRDNAIIWGYFDNSGVYKNLGYAEVNHAGTDHHTLRVISGELSYSIYLDDRLVVQGVPFPSKSNAGYIGLLTSVASVIYDEVSLGGVGAAFKGNYTSLDGFTDQRIVSGKWTLANNKIVQTVPDAADYVWNTGVEAAKYTITATIILPKGSTTVGAGFILNMATRSSKNNSYIIRLTNAGQGIWWGANDASGKFKGQGSVSLPFQNTGTLTPSASPGPTQTPGNSLTFLVKVVVDAGKMTVFVNDNQIAADISMTGVSGWIGLVSYGGPVTFQDVKLEVIE